MVHFAVPFTRHNKRGSNNAVLARPDRALANVHWLKLYLSAILYNLPIIGSDHSPILHDMSHLNTPHRLSYFKFEASGFLIKVSLIWFKMFGHVLLKALMLIRKTQLLKQAIKKLE